MRAFSLLSSIVLVSPCPATAAKQIMCGPGDVRHEIDINTIALQYEGHTFTVALSAILGANVSFDRKTLQQAAVVTQQWNEILKGLVAGFNSCAITKEHYAEALKSLYPQLKTQAADLNGIRKLLSEGRQLDEKRLQRMLEQYFATLQKFVSLSGQKLILKQLQAVEARVVTGTETLVAGQDKILKELDQIKQGLRPPPPAPNLPEKEVARELTEVRKELTSRSESVEKEYAEGNSYYKEKKFDTAISHFKNAIDLVPGIPSLYLALGNSYYASHRYNDAVATCERGLKETKEGEKVYIDLLAIRGSAKEGLGYHQEAIDDLSLAIKLNPNLARAYKSRANAKFMLNDFQGAIADSTAAIELNPEDADYYYNRALAKGQLNDISGAIDDYTASIKLSPDHDDAYYNRALAKIRLNDISGAIADYTAAIKLKPDDADSYFNRGLAKGQLNDNQGAIDDYTASIKLSPDHGDAYYSRGLAKGQLNDNQGAIADFTATIKLGPSLEEEAYWSRGLAHTAVSNEKEATDDFNKARELSSKAR